MKKLAKSIEYLDATPAAGKTREARRLITHHLLGESPSIFVYAAPTHALLDEVELSLRDAVGKDIYDVQAVRVYPGKSPTAQYSYLMGLMSDSVAKKLMEPKAYERAKADKKNVRAILCTHECLIQAPRDTSNESNSATIIFDEARNCVLRDLEVKVSKQALRHINDVFELRELERNTNEVVIDGESYTSTLSSLSSKGFPDPSKLMKKFGVGELKDLPKYVLGLYRMKEVCMGGRADVLIETLVPTRSRVDQQAYIVGLSRPSSIFEGYGRVIVMSAYFTHSQMYHLLLNAHVGHQRGEQIFNLVPYKASDVFQRMSDLITENSLRNLRVGALLKDTRSGKLTSTFLSSGMVVTPKLQEALIERGQLKKAEVIKCAFEKLPVPGLTEKENKVLWACANPPLFSLHRIAFEALTNAKVETALCFTNAFGSNSTGAIYKVGKEKVINTVDFMQTVPLSLMRDAYKPQRKYVTKPMQMHLAEATARRFFVIPKSTSVLGLNSYDHLKAFVHLAALNPKPAVARVLKRVLPNYEPDLDYSISNIIQTMYRTSLRNPDSKEEVFCLVLSEWIIEQIERVCFAGRHLKRIKGHEPKFIELNYAYQNKEDKSKAGKASRLRVTDEVRKELGLLKRRVENVSERTKAKKVSALKKMAEKYPELRKNITKWLQKKKL